MQLHRVGKQADWVEIPVASRNTWQRIAASSNGYVTPANLVTTLGLVLVILGCWQLICDRYWLGLCLILIGRAGDILDGWLADITGTKSPFGQALDALFDKLASLAALIALYATNLVPVWLLASIFCLQLVTSLFSIAYQLSGKPRQPTIEGKIGAAIYWVCLGGYILVAALSINSVVFNIVLASSGVVALILGLVALRDYLKPRTS